MLSAFLPSLLPESGLAAPGRYANDWASRLIEFQAQPVALHPWGRKKRRDPKNFHDGTAHIELDSIIVYGDGKLSFSVQTHGYPVGGKVWVELDTGTPMESGRGDFSNPNFRRYQSLSAVVEADQTAHFMTDISNRQGAYLKMRLPWHEMKETKKSPILTFPIQGPPQPCGRIFPEPNDSCRILFGYGGAGQR